MTDAELIAAAAMANIEAVQMAGENADRARNGYMSAWRPETGLMEWGLKVQQELYRREKAAPEEPHGVSRAKFALIIEGSGNGSVPPIYFERATIRDGVVVGVSLVVDRARAMRFDTEEAALDHPVCERSGAAADMAPLVVTKIEEP